MQQLDSPIVVRRSTRADTSSLRSLAELCGGGWQRDGDYLVAEARGEVVAAVGLGGRSATLHNPRFETRDIRELLKRWRRGIRRAREPAVTHARRGAARLVTRS